MKRNKNVFPAFFVLIAGLIAGLALNTSGFSASFHTSKNTVGMNNRRKK